MTLIDAVMLVVGDEEKNSKEDIALLLSYLPQIEESLQNQTKSWNMLKSLNYQMRKSHLYLQKKERFVGMLMTVLLLLMRSPRNRIHR